jgi:hypothetical protein
LRSSILSRSCPRRLILLISFLFRAGVERILASISITLTPKNIDYKAPEMIYLSQNLDASLRSKAQPTASHFSTQAERKSVMVSSRLFLNGTLRGTLQLDPLPDCLSSRVECNLASQQGMLIIPGVDLRHCGKYAAWWMLGMIQLRQPSAKGWIAVSSYIN